MKKGIFVHCDFDGDGLWHLVVEKTRGKLTLDEIRDAAREWEFEYYLLMLDCYHDPIDEPQFADTSPNAGDRAVLYRAGNLLHKDRR